MGRDVRFLICSTNEACTAELRSVLRSTPMAKVVAEVDEPALLQQAVGRFHADAVLLDLDPSPAAALKLMAGLGGDANVAVFATSKSTEGALILQAMRMGVKEFLPKPVDAEALTEAVAKLATEQIESAPLGKLITVMGAAGGVGSTFLATNLAVELALIAEGDVTVVDFDYRFGQVATVLDIDPTFTLSDLCESPEQLEPQVIERAMMKHDTGVRVLSRPSSFAEADTITAASCVGLLSTLVQLNEYVVVDGPVRSDVRAKAVLSMADVNMLIIQLLVPCVRNASRILGVMRESGDELEQTRLISNRLGRGTAHLSLGDVAKTLSLDVFASIPEDWTTVSGAINLGEPLATHSPKSKVRIAIQEIANRLRDADSPSNDQGVQKKGLIGRIFAQD